MDIKREYLERNLALFLSASINNCDNLVVAVFLSGLLVAPVLHDFSETGSALRMELSFLH